ncbi:4-hydroxy-tetrahydrodipicolinate synthase [Actinomadura rugatobispora]|uniref:4-hydroxy-tetrahydrodipicolinate synthase n=1 Tax=Actinomadura rugatobispora TaxID=1994 RepID=A0ABW0ZRI3_9ACTN|nr:2,4-dihydroxyhept-2-ene-1,7-dioic acid aldolase [Actinomadura rugatobispora]
MSAAELPPAFLRGSYVPLITPFTDGQVDYDALAAQVERQVEAGSDGVVVTGTSGEPSVLTGAERAACYEVAVGAAQGRIPVVAATGAGSLAETLELSRHAAGAGAAALLVVTPYYIKPPQRGLIDHFTRVASIVDLPVLIYHIPGRSGVTMTVDSVRRVAEEARNVVGVKHASTDLAWATELLTTLGPDFRLFCGLEEMSFPMLGIGASGLMNAVGNIVPRRVAELCQAVAKGDLAMARILHYELFELNQAVFWDTNPIPIKYLMTRLGTLAGGEHRPPLSPPVGEVRARLDELAVRLAQRLK